MPLPKIMHPMIDVEIPSTKKKIRVRPYLVKEEKILMFAKQSGNNNDMLGAIKQIVQNCIVDKVDVNKLAVFDLEYLFLKLRALSVNNVAKISIKDEEDEKVYDLEVNLDEIQVKFPEKDNKVVQIDQTYSLLMKYPEATIYADPEPDTAEESLDYYLDKTISKVVTGDEMVNWATCTKEEKQEFINDLPAKTLDAVKEFWGNMPKMEHKIKYTNKKGNEKEIVLNRLADFFTF